jgi:hypothetical protein
MAKVSLLGADIDEDDKEEKPNSNSRETRRIQRMKAKQTVKTESDLMSEVTLSSLRASVLEEVRGYFPEGSKLAQHLANDPLAFLQSVSAELQDLVILREQLKGQWRSLQCNFTSLQQQQHYQHGKKKNPVKQKKPVSLAVRKSSRNRSSKNDEDHEDNTSEDNANGLNDQQDDQNSYEDLDLEAYEVQMDQRKVLLANLQSKFQQVPSANYTAITIF